VKSVNSEVGALGFEASYGLKPDIAHVRKAPLQMIQELMFLARMSVVTMSCRATIGLLCADAVPLAIGSATRFKPN
jgi:hypothetical protein